MRYSALFGILFLTTASSGCIETYTATGLCTRCVDGKKQITPLATTSGVFYCTEDAAEQDLKGQCPDGALGNVIHTPELVLDLGQCGESDFKLSRLWNPSSLLEDLWSIAFPPQQMVAATTEEGEFCEDVDPRLSFTVIVNNEFRPINSCPNAKEMRIAYTVYLEEDLPDVAVLSAQVPFGGSHQFTVSDGFSRQQDGGKVLVSVLAQSYAVTGPMDCTLVPFDEGVFQTSYRLSDGDQLIINENPETGGFIPTITSGGSSSLREQKITAKNELRPTPDPRFTKEIASP